MKGKRIVSSLVLAVMFFASLFVSPTQKVEASASTQATQSISTEPCADELVMVVGAKALRKVLGGDGPFDATIKCVNLGKSLVVEVKKGGIRYTYQVVNDPTEPDTEAIIFTDTLFSSPRRNSAPIGDYWNYGYGDLTKSRYPVNGNLRLVYNMWWFRPYVTKEVLVDYVGPYVKVFPITSIEKVFDETKLYSFVGEVVSVAAKDDPDGWALIFYKPDYETLWILPVINTNGLKEESYVFRWNPDIQNYQTKPEKPGAAAK